MKTKGIVEKKATNMNQQKAHPILQFILQYSIPIMKLDFHFRFRLAINHL